MLELKICLIKELTYLSICLQSSVDTGMEDFENM